MGGLISYPFQQRGAIINFNTTILSGMYLISDSSSTVIGKPENITYGFAIIGNVPRSSTEVYYIQMAFSLFGNREFYVRAGTVNPNEVDLSDVTWGRVNPVYE